MPNPETTRGPAKSHAWSALTRHAAQIKDERLRDLLQADGDRYSRFSIELEPLLVDFSRCLATDETLDLLIQLANEMQLSAQIENLLHGAMLNSTEKRAALHAALRGTGPVDLLQSVDVSDVAGDVEAELGSFLSFADAVRTGEHLGYTGKRITQIVNIGIGGSDLGPRLVSDALAKSNEPLTASYVAGIDGMELDNALRAADPESTLFVICSKTFTTLETRINADAARVWLLNSLPPAAVAAHFAAVSVNDSAMDEFGIASDARFRIWDWVGGRFSLWSAIGLSTALAIGGKAFRELLSGAAAMDEHFRTAPMGKNIPVVLGLLAVWQQNFLRIRDHVILPYDQRLELLPAYLQQLFMESLGKSVRHDGGEVDYSTGAPVWGTVGSHSQHSFAQLLHQGTAKVQVDYIGTVNGPDMVINGGHIEGLANMIAQAESLAVGQNELEVAQALSAAGQEDEVGRLSAHKIHSGNRPSNIILLRELDARSLGMLLALYEHQVFVQASIWGINPFDQWGVELGKIRAGRYAEFLRNESVEKLPGIGECIFRWLK